MARANSTVERSVRSDTDLRVRLRSDLDEGKSSIPSKPAAQTAQSPNPRSRPGLLLVPILLLAAAVQVLSLARGLVPWSSDQGIVALMGRHIALGIAHPIFCYGSYYGGTLEPHLTAIVFSLLGMTRFTYRLSLMLFLAALLLLVYAIGRRFLGRREGVVAAGYLAFPPFYFLLKGLTSDGAYDSLAFLGGMIAFASLRLEEALGTRSPARRWFVLLGVAAGLAWWVHPLSVYFWIAVVAWFLIVRPGVFLRFRDLLVFVLSFALGSLPWWIGNVGRGWLSLRTHEATTLPLPLAAKGFFRFFSEAVPVLFGARSFYSAQESFRGARWIALAIYAAPMIATVVRLAKTGVRKPKKGVSPADLRDSRALLLLLTLVLAMHAFTSLSQRTYEADPRFLFPVYVPFSLLFGYWIVRLYRTRRAIALAAGIAVAALHAVDLAKTEPQENWPTTGTVAPLIRTLNEIGIQDVYTGYWTAYRLAFESGERIRPGIFGVEAADRYPDYTRAVDLSKSPAVVLHGPEADQFRDYLVRRRSRARSVRVGPHAVFWELEPAILEEIRRTRGVPPAG